MKTKKADVVVISPHPDDAEFGAAGSVAGFIRDGKSVVYVICTNGDKGTDDINVKPVDLAKTREQEQLAAAEVLGVREVVFLRYPDQGLGVYVAAAILDRPFEPYGPASFAWRVDKRQPARMPG